MGKAGKSGLSRDQKRAAKVREKRRQEAVRSSAEERRADYDRLVEQARAEDRLGLREEAVESLLEALRALPGGPEALLSLDRHLRPARALEVFEGMERKGHVGPALWYLLAIRLCHAKRFAEALERLDRLLDPSSTAELDRWMRFPKGAAAAIAEIRRHAETTVRLSRKVARETAEPDKAVRPVPRPAPAPAAEATPPAPLPEVGVRTHVETAGFEAVLASEPADLERVLLQIEAGRLAVIAGFESLLCLDGLQGLRRFDHQIETALRVLRVHRGRALLADEVGLGKTIEACLVLKEYVVRGLVRRALILVPPNLVSQWVEELSTKFGLEFASTADRRCRREPERFWKEEPRIVASIATARSARHAPLVQGAPWDLVVVDEAHHLKSRRNRGWRLVSDLPRRFVLLLTATPVQNDLIELHNLITLLSPGTLETESAFRKRYVDRKDPRKPRNPEELRALLAGVMVRNTRGLSGVDLPPRFASTHVARPASSEADLYSRADAIAGRAFREGALPRMTAALPLQAAGSSPAALARAASNLARGAARGTDLAGEFESLAEAAAGVESTAKFDRLLEIVGAGTEKVLVFTRFRATIEHLERRLAERGIGRAVFHGSLPPAAKEQAIEDFARDVPVLLSTEAGGEGRNLQFCRSIVNFDLPWNPMRIEQRIGRIHRIGQEREVHVFNLALAGSIEEEILRVLDEKLNLFELVIGETGMILGQLPHRQDFEDLALEMWYAAANASARREAFDRLGEELSAARADYQAMKDLDRDLFHDDYGA